MKKIIISSLLLANTLFAGDVLAVVNGTKIKKDTINNLLKTKNITYDKLPAKTKLQLLDQMVIDTLLIQKAEKSNLKKTDEYKKGIALLEKQFLLKLFLQKKLSSFKVTDNEIKNFYYQYKDIAFKQPEQVKAKHILVKTKQEAYKIINILKHTSKSKFDEEFSKLAKKYSIDSTKKFGGELGWLTKDKVILPIRNVMFKLKKGSFSLQPIPTKVGWDIIYIEDKKISKYIPLNKVKNKIIETIKLEKLKSYISELKTKAKIEYK